MFGSSNQGSLLGRSGASNTGAGTNGLFGTTSGGFFGSTAPNSTSLSGAAPNSTPSGGGGGLFGGGAMHSAGGGGFFGTTPNGGGGGIFGTSATGGAPFFGSTTTGATGLFGQSGTNAGDGLFGSNTATSMQNSGGGGSLFGQASTPGTGLFSGTQSGGINSGLFNATTTNTGLSGGTDINARTSGFFGTAGGNGWLGGALQPMAQTNMSLGGTAPPQVGGASVAQPQWLFGNSFGLGLQHQSPEAQIEVLKSQLMAYGIDLAHLPPPLPHIIPRVGNPNLRTLQLLVHLVGRMLNLRAVKNRSSELICFVFTRAPSVEIAHRFQLQCDQQVSQMGAQFVQKLSRAKKTSPEPRSHYFTRPIVGFEGLKERVKEQNSFFETFGCALKALQEKQKKSHEEFCQKALDKLTLIRQRQAEMRQKLICLVGGLEEFAARAQGFEGDEQELAQMEEEYDRLQRQLSSNPESLQRAIPPLREKLNVMKRQIEARPASPISNSIRP